MEKIRAEDIANLNTVWELPKNKKPIVIIGAGAMGSRHLQGLKKITRFPCEIYVIDRNQISLDAAIERYCAGRQNEPLVAHCRGVRFILEGRGRAAESGSETFTAVPFQIQPVRQRHRQRDARTDRTALG